MDGSVEALPSIMTIRAARSAQPHATEHRDFGGADVCVMMMLLMLHGEFYVLRGPRASLEATTDADGGNRITAAL